MTYNSYQKEVSKQLKKDMKIVKNGGQKSDLIIRLEKMTKGTS